MNNQQQQQPAVTIDLLLDRLTTKEVLHAVIHAILFHRLFGTIKPSTTEVLDVTMPGVNDPEIKPLVDDKVDAFWKAVESGANKRGQISIIFAEKRPKKNWFSMGEEEVPWELWTINAEVRQPKTEPDRQAFLATLSSTLTKTLYSILGHTSSDRGRAAVPPITTQAGVSPFPFRISVKVGGVEVG